MKNPHAAALGSLGGQSKSKAKKKASAENGKKGGAPKKTYLRRGEYCPSPIDFIYFETTRGVFWAAQKTSSIEVYFGESCGGGEYFDLKNDSRKKLISIVTKNGYSLSKLMEYVRKNALNDIC